MEHVEVSDLQELCYINHWKETFPDREVGGSIGGACTVTSVVSDSSVLWAVARRERTGLFLRSLFGFPPPCLSSVCILIQAPVSCWVSVGHFGCSFFYTPLLASHPDSSWPSTEKCTVVIGFPPEEITLPCFEDVLTFSFSSIWTLFSGQFLTEAGLWQSFHWPIVKR